jgi:hypothetical protein
LLGQILSAVYFLYYFIRFLAQYVWDSLLNF